MNIFSALIFFTAIIVWLVGSNLLAKSHLKRINANTENHTDLGPLVNSLFKTFNAKEWLVFLALFVFTFSCIILAVNL
jgi:hypothetical protein